MATSEPQIEAHDELIEELRDIVGDENVLSEPEELLVYECDGLPQHKHAPRAVVFPTSTEETSQVLKALSSAGVSFAPRGAGTGLSGGALAVNRGFVIELARMRKILKIDPENRIAVVQTGLVNAQLSRAVSPYGLYYVPDPSSQPSCTIGGNIAENAGGIHCLKYGTTTDHVLATRVVLSGGSIVELDSRRPGYDLLGVFIGSEGTFGIATEATLRLLPIPPAIRTLLADFTDVDDASRAVSAIIAAGMLPAALEMMDNEIIRAVEASVFTAGLPVDAQAVLLVELDGIEAGIDDDAQKAEAILRGHGARSVRLAADENERKKLWAARKGAFGAVGRLSPDIMIQDAVVPRSRLPEVLSETYRISAQYKLKLANVFHAGDGNLHPLICFDLRRGDDLERVRQAGREIMETCVRAGGSITGEHGVGLDKSSYLPLIFSDEDLSAMMQVRAAFDPLDLCNPGKIIPAPKGCGEARAVATRSFPLPLGRLGEGLVQRNSVPKEEGDVKANQDAPHPGKAAQKQNLITSRLHEGRIAHELTQIVGDVGVRRLMDLQLDLKANGRTERILEIAPATEDQAQEVLKFAARADLAVVPAGARTRIDVGNLLMRADLILSARRMNRVVSHEPADLVATAQAGLPVSTFEESLAEAGQWLPIDYAGEATTLGGLIARGIRGPLASAFGPPGSFVIGLRAVLADGRLIKAGGKVVKNVAGYDLCKLFTGSYGTLGFITELTFKLRPLPVETRTVMASGGLSSLADCGRTIAKELSPISVELCSPGMRRQLRLSGRANEHALLVSFAGSERAVIWQTAQALKIAREKNGNECTTLDNEDVWQDLNAAAVSADCDLLWSAWLKQTLLYSFLQELAAVESDASRAAIRWHAGVADGRVQVIDCAPIYHREAVRALEQLRDKAENFGGSLIIERAPKEIKNEFDSWGNFGSTSQLMRRVKGQLDPQNIFSPGKMFT